MGAAVVSPGQPMPDVTALIGIFDKFWPATVATTPLALTSLAPSSVVHGVVTPVTLTGTGFTSGCSVVVDGVSHPTTYVSETSLTYSAQAPLAGSQTLLVKTATGQKSGTQTLTVT